MPSEPASSAAPVGSAATVADARTDGIPAGNAYITATVPQFHNGVSATVTARTASSTNMLLLRALGTLLTLTPGEWGVFSAPAVGNQATATRAAFGGGTHVARRVSFGFSSSAALAGITTITFNLRDGISGAGTILASWQFALPAAIIAPYSVSYELNLPSIAGTFTAMTLEQAAIGPGILSFVNLHGTDAI